jgi:hypothetical protein
MLSRPLKCESDSISVEITIRPPVFADMKELPHEFAPDLYPDGDESFSREREAKYVGRRLGLLVEDVVAMLARVDFWNAELSSENP